MAQSDSSPSPELTNGAVVHSPVDICSDLDTQRGREGEEGEEEDEDVELAEEVGEDVLMMDGAGEGQVERESREESEREDMRIIQVTSIPNDVVRQGEGEGDSLEENGEEGVELEDEEHEIGDEQTGENGGEVKEEEELKDIETMTETPCHFSALMEAEKCQEQMLDSDEENKEDREDEENKQVVVIESSETEVREDKTNEGDDGLEEHQSVSSTDDAELVQDSVSLAEEESGEGMQLSSYDTDTAEVVTLPVDGEITETIEDPTTETTEIIEQVSTEDNGCQTSTVKDNGSVIIDTTEVVDNQTNQVTLENEDKMKIVDEKDNSGSSKQEAESINNNNTGQQEDCIEAEAEIEGNREIVKDAKSASDDVLDIEGEVKQKEEQPDLVFVSCEGQSRTEGGTEETSMVGINQKVLEEEQVRQVWDNTLTVMDGGGQSTEEAGERGDNGVRDSLREEEHREGGDQEMQEEEIVQVENQTEVDLPEPVLKCVETEPLHEEQDVDLDKVEEAFELEEGGDVESEKPGVEITPEENESTTEEGSYLQEHPLQLLKETGTDRGENLREQLSQQALVEEEKGKGAEEEAIEAEVEMAEEPVTVLDDEIEEIEDSPCTELDEQKPALITSPSEEIEVSPRTELDEQKPTPNTSPSEKIEVSPCTELDEQKPAPVTSPSEDTIVEKSMVPLEDIIVETSMVFKDTIAETKDGEYHKLHGQKVELGKENDEKQKDKEEEVQQDKEDMELDKLDKDEKPKDDSREVELAKDDSREVEMDINGRVKGLKQAMENGILSPEPQPLRKEELGTARVLSARRKDNDWIKKDQPEEERPPEVKDWRKELRSVKKDIRESESGRKEWVKKETSSENKSPPRKEDWIKELKSVIKDESLPRKRDEQVKKKRVVLLEDGHSYFPQREEISEKREEVKLISHRRVESPLPPLRRNHTTPQDQDYEISLYVKVMNCMNQHILYVHPELITLYIY